MKRRAFAIVLAVITVVMLTGCGPLNAVKTIMKKKPVITATPARAAWKADEKPASEETADYYSTEEKPSIGDFEWFTTQIQPVLDVCAVPETVSENMGITDRAGAWNSDNTFTAQSASKLLTMASFYERNGKHTLLAL